MTNFIRKSPHQSRLALSLLITGLGWLAGPPVARAQGPQVSGVTRKQLLRQALPLTPVAGVLLNEITLAPGQRTPDHHHPGEVYSYVLAGEIQC